MKIIGNDKKLLEVMVIQECYCMLQRRTVKPSVTIITKPVISSKFVRLNSRKQYYGVLVLNL